MAEVAWTPRVVVAWAEPQAAGKQEAADTPEASRTPVASAPAVAAKVASKQVLRQEGLALELAGLQGM